jgi:hypothetical protein
MGRFRGKLIDILLSNRQNSLFALPGFTESGELPIFFLIEGGNQVTKPSSPHALCSRGSHAQAGPQIGLWGPPVRRLQNTMTTDLCSCLVIFSENRDILGHIELHSGSTRLRVKSTGGDIMGVWQGVAMDSLKYHQGPPCPTLLRPAGGPPLKQPYGHFRGFREFHGFQGRPAVIF